jgi:hypothetical protein
MTAGFLSHIERAPSGLPVVQYHARKLAIRTSRKTGKDRMDVWNDFDTDFVEDMDALQSGWVSYREGVGRVLTVEPVTPIPPRSASPSPPMKKSARLPSCRSSVARGAWRNWRSRIPRTVPRSAICTTRTLRPPNAARADPRGAFSHWCQAPLRHRRLAQTR